MENSKCKYILTIGLFLDNIRQACEISGGVEKIIVLGMEETPEDCASFMQMMIYDDGSLYEEKREFDVYNDLVALPFSSGTTGPPKGVALTHHNFVSNMTQLNHPDITMLRDIRKDTSLYF